MTSCAKSVGPGRLHALDAHVRAKLDEEKTRIDADDADAIVARMMVDPTMTAIKGGGLNVVRAVARAFGKEAVDVVYRSKTNGFLGAFRVSARDQTCVCLGCDRTLDRPLSLANMEAHVMKDGKPTRREIERFAFRIGAAAGPAGPAGVTYVSIAEVARRIATTRRRTEEEPRPEPEPEPPNKKMKKEKKETDDDATTTTTTDAIEVLLLDACCNHAAVMQRLGRPEYALDVMEAARDVVRRDPRDARTVADMLAAMLRPFAEDPDVMGHVQTVLDQETGTSATGAACRAVASAALAKAPRDVLRAVAAADPPLAPDLKRDVANAAAAVAERAARLFEDHAHSLSPNEDNERKRGDDDLDLDREVEVVKSLAKAVRRTAAELSRETEQQRKRTVRALVHAVRACDASAPA